MSAQVFTIPDKRLVYNGTPIFNRYVGALKWEQYKIPASGLSDDSLTFANLITLGPNRLYSSSFEIEYTATFHWRWSNPHADFVVSPEEFMGFHAFPLHSVTNQIRINLNGGALTSRPQQWLRVRERYWPSRKMHKYLTVCPHRKGDTYTSNPDGPVNRDLLAPTTDRNEGLRGSWKWCIENITMDDDQTGVTMRVTFREPILCSPFNARLDQVYQRPIFGITSLDINYHFDDLGLMPFFKTGTGAQNVTCHINSAQLCFQVASLPAGQTVEPHCTLPYHEHTFYVTDINMTQGIRDGDEFTVTSGVYTLAQVPQAIWIYVAPRQEYLQHQLAEYGANREYHFSFANCRNLSLTLGNNTQILNTASQFELYKMCLANGLQETPFQSFCKANGGFGMGSLLRLIPGVDINIPDQELVPGTDAGQLVFQVQGTFDWPYRKGLDVVPGWSPDLSLYIMFDYTGILDITPAHADIDMIPIKSAAAVSAAPVVVPRENEGAADNNDVGTATGAGILDFLKTAGKWVAKKGLLTKGAQYAERFLNGMGYGPSVKRARGGALMGGGDFYT